MTFASFIFFAFGSLTVATKVVAVAGTVYGLLQVVKKFLPVTGAAAVAFNVVFSVVGYVAVVQPANFFSLETLFGVITVAATAAGFHGTVSKLSA